MPKPFRFAMQLNGAPSGTEWRELARRTEDMGYSTLFVPDHFDDQWSPIVAITSAAEATSTLRVGSLVFDNDYRHPVVLAKELATLDLLTEGRVEAGLGAGWMRTDYEASGIPYDDPAVRVARFEEGLQIMKALWADGTCTFSGVHYEIRYAKGLPRPHSSPHPPIVVGGGGRRVLSIAARHADIIGVNANLRSGEVGLEVAASTVPERFDERVRWIKEAAGERFDRLELQILTVIAAVTDDRDGMAEAFAPAFGLEPTVALDIQMVLVGTVDQICETLIERRERWGFSYYVLHVQDIDAFAPVVERLTGT